MTDPPAARILLVEDDEVGGALLVELLGSLGEVQWTTTAEQALELADGRDWDLLVADIELPAMNGLELIREIKRTATTIATLVLSGHASFDYAVAALRAGADDYMRQAGRARRADREGARADRRSRASAGARAARSCSPSARIPTTSRSASAGSCCATSPRATRSRS